MQHSIVILFISILTIYSCGKECKDPLRTPDIGYESPVYDGQDLTLTAAGDGNDDYSWTGPNGYVATGKVVDLGFMNSQKSGIYTVIVEDKDCGTESSSTNIQVIVPEAPCTPAINKVEFDRFPTIVDTMPECGLSDFYDAYAMIFASLAGSVTIIFPGPQKPFFNKNYTVAGSAEELNEREVRIEIFTGTGPGTRQYFATDGLVYVRADSETINITFCDMLITSDTEVGFMTGSFSCMP